ncbi:MAG: cytochrome c554 family protein [Desulfobacter sp.]|nr:MAG: cytochrome c554 family protein [Desulfobacter sp.]
MGGRVLRVAVSLFLMVQAGQASAKGRNATRDTQPVKQFTSDQFIDPETCAGCHSQIFGQWQYSMHNLSHQDEVYNRVAKFLREGLVHEGEIKEAESCVKCHTPVGYVSGFPRQLSDDLSKTPEIAVQGIQCDYCHSAVDVEKMYNNGLVLSPGQGEDDPGIKYGPFDDCEPDFHEAAFSKLHGDSKICGTCHNVKHLAFGTDLETTYTEWENSPYNSSDPEKRVTCQGCHMYQRPGVPATGSTKRPENPGAATDYSDERPHIFTHYFVGGNTAGFDGGEKAAMAVERLQNAASLDLDLSLASQGKINVIVTNSGAGHSLPTGVGDLRQVWIELNLFDDKGNLCFSTGGLDEKKELDPLAVVFKTVFGDGQGNPVVNIAKARQILSDTRIPAGQSLTHTFETGVLPQKGWRVKARLLYRGMDQKILNLLPGTPIPALPVVEMEKISQTF